MPRRPSVRSAQAVGTTPPLLGHDLSKWDLLGERMQLYLMDYGIDSAGKNQIDQPVR